MLKLALFDDTPISYKYSYNFPSLPGYFFSPFPRMNFSLPTQEFFRGQGKIKVGTGMEIMKPESSKIIDG
jgi:hypothetical protein